MVILSFLVLTLCFLFCLRSCEASLDGKLNLALLTLRWRYFIAFVCIFLLGWCVLFSPLILRFWAVVFSVILGRMNGWILKKFQFWIIHSHLLRSLVGNTVVFNSTQVLRVLCSGVCWGDGFLLIYLGIFLQIIFLRIDLIWASEESIKLKAARFVKVAIRHVSFLSGSRNLTLIFLLHLLIPSKKTAHLSFTVPN